MMRKILKLGVLCASLFAFVYAAPIANYDEAKKAAEAIYQKQESFAATVLAAQPKYQSWLAKEQAEIKKAGLKFGSFRQGKQENGNQSFILDIESPKAQNVAITVRYPENSEILLNCEKIAENIKGGSTEVLYDGRKIPDWDQGKMTRDPQILALNLKQGKNTLAMNVLEYNRNFRHESYFRPYADTAILLKGFACKDYGRYMDIIRNYWFPRNEEYDIWGNNDFYNLLSRGTKNAIERSTFSAGKFEKQYQKMEADKLVATSPEWINLYSKIVSTMEVERNLEYNIDNLSAAIADLSKKKGYPAKYAQELKKFVADMPAIMKALEAGDNSGGGKLNDYKKFAREALLANPALKAYPNWIYVARKNGTPHDGFPANWQGNSVLRERERWGDEIWSMNLADPDSAKLLFSSADAPAVTDMEIDWDAKKIMFSSLDAKNRWQLYEINADGSDLKMLTPGIHESVDAYDGVYLPNGKIIFCYTACWVGVPCVGGADYVANLYIMDPKAGSPEAVDKSIRQLTFEQDADWMPTVMNDGRVMYTRWEYTDNSHYFSRILMRMNPDGTSQSAYYGSTSYWPNSIFYTRPIPNDPTKFMSIITGHHGISRSGELHLFDVAKGTLEDQGRIHKFPSYGREYIAETKDQLVDGKFPQILHPYPITEDLVVAAVKTPYYDFALYLIDKHDNMVLLQKKDRAKLLEPMPMVARKKPAIIPDTVSPKLKANPKLDTGNIFLNDIYQGPGLAGIPKGEIKALRVFEYVYAYRNMGSHEVIGQEGSWDVKRIHGTVDVEADGSAMFKVPANRPIAIQPLDKDGKALALMRSWFTVMPGETQSCVGCHEGQGMTPVSAAALAARKAPQTIKEYRAPVRGFSFDRDVQPTIDKFCVGCHDGSDPDRPMLKKTEHNAWRRFSNAYMALHPFVRRSGPESNQNLLSPAEFTANTSELVQMLKKGHHGVELDDEAWRVFYTWIDLNVPYLGSWKEVSKTIPHNGDVERKKFLALYANRFDDPDEITWFPEAQKFVAPKPAKEHKTIVPELKDFPFDAKDAAKKIANTKLPKEIVREMGEGKSMRFTLVPAGSFVMGTNEFFYDEGPAQVAKVSEPFYMAQFETTNAQYAQFDKKHDSGYQDRHWKDHVNRGYPSNTPEQPVVRVSWKEAKEFCDWMSKKYGLQVSLPTEKQWEWAARGGSDKDFWFGNVGTDFSAYDNLADVTTKKFAVEGIDPQPRRNPEPAQAFVPADLDFDDGELIAVTGGTFAPNPFNLYDMNGNVAEWTLDDYTKTLGGEKVEGFKVVRGGSWRDRSKWARVTVRRNYPDWQKVYNVGFRVVINDAAKAAETLKVAAPLPVKPLKFGRAVKEVKDLTPYMSQNPKDLIVNGGFDFPEVSEDHNMVEKDDVPGWDTSDTRFEIWRAGSHGSPKNDSTGNSTGQQIEVAANGNGTFQVWQTVQIPLTVKTTSATLSFEAWPRNDTNVADAIIIVNGKQKAIKRFEGERTKWTKNTLTVPNLKGGDTVKILFKEQGNSAGWHIDSVTFLIK